MGSSTAGVTVTDDSAAAISDEDGTTTDTDVDVKGAVDSSLPSDPSPFSQGEKDICDTKLWGPLQDWELELILGCSFALQNSSFMELVEEGGLRSGAFDTLGLGCHLRRGRERERRESWKIEEERLVTNSSLAHVDDLLGGSRSGEDPSLDPYVDFIDSLYLMQSEHFLSSVPFDFEGCLLFRMGLHPLDTSSRQAYISYRNQSGNWSLFSQPTASVQKVDVRLKEWRFYVHYLGWKKSWDEWVSMDRLMKFTEENMQKQVVLNKKKSTEKITKTGGARGKKRKIDSVEKEKDNLTPEKLLNILLPSTLKKQLVDDCEFITHLGKLVRLPRNPNVDDILKKYLDHRLKKDGAIADSIEEILNGLRCYFDKALPAMLLYKSERQQYQDATADHVPPSTVYGAEHLLRLFVKLPEMLCYANIEEETLKELQQKLLDFLKYNFFHSSDYSLQHLEALSSLFAIFVALELHVQGRNKKTKLEIEQIFKVV
ncbi:hypothetical protein RHSIM_Rhsim06G0056800 [Rhododendron simsii]|uniref:MRG domain-containing protein n=1 Tax=Rhododendron simsii TaxID=118357 RepID=A0A834GUB9_RHOSS|nr:hypothetical protein RHSIM_Rhsim06G0056800 [Rhododendron simsii]